MLNDIRLVRPCTYQHMGLEHASAKGRRALDPCLISAATLGHYRFDVAPQRPRHVIYNSGTLYLHSYRLTAGTLLAQVTH